MKNYFQKLKCKNMLAEGGATEEHVGSFLTSKGAQMSPSFIFNSFCLRIKPKPRTAESRGGSGLL